MSERGIQGKPVGETLFDLAGFQTTILADQEFLVGKHDGKPATIAGELRTPSPGTAHLPAVAVAHGSGGIGANVEAWVLLLNGAGVATYVEEAPPGGALAARLSGLVGSLDV